MDIVIPKSQKIIEERISQLDDCWLIQHTAFKHGYDITLAQAEEIWLDYSDENWCSWMSNNMTKTDCVWNQINKYFEGKEELDSEYTDALMRPFSDYVINIEIHEKNLMYAHPITYCMKGSTGVDSTDVYAVVTASDEQCASVILLAELQRCGINKLTTCNMTEAPKCNIAVVLSVDKFK